ncbi:hypothetical protein [Amycolatopsis sp. lyj-23]|uniref:hypothetical protein n=1 Tax=Amycolatopsis sp. lyj-23 TaxID=2789283 RepID=UPI00397E4599
MTYEERKHAGRYYGVQFMYAVPDDAWFVELSDVTSGSVIMIGVVPDENLTVEPAVRVCAPAGHCVPFEVMAWFMEKIAEEIARSRPAPNAPG